MKIINTLLLLAGCVTAVQAQAQVCDNGTGKTIALNGFELAAPEHARWGGLQEMESRLPAILADELNASGQHRAVDASQVNLRPAYPGQLTHNPLVFNSAVLNDVPSYVRDTVPTIALPDTQFLLTGYIESVAPSNDQGLPRLDRVVRRGLALMDKRYHQPRRLAVVAELVNRFTGERVWRQRFIAKGNWTRPQAEQTGMSEPRFWHSEFGRDTVRLISRMVRTLDETLACRPLMAAVEEVSGSHIRLGASWSGQVLPQSLSQQDVRVMKRSQDAVSLEIRHEALPVTAQLTGQSGVLHLADAAGWNIQPGDWVVLAE